MHNRSAPKLVLRPDQYCVATISNNVPVTEWSLGSDTSINVLVDACDSIRQSASASRNRVFVVETQGGESGYIALLGGLAVSRLIMIFANRVMFRRRHVHMHIDSFDPLP